MKNYNDETGIWIKGPCTVCKTPISALETFPGGRCLACWEKITYRGFTAQDVREIVKAKR